MSDQSKNYMDPGERIVRCFTGEDVDHVPFGVGIGWGTWGETMTQWKEESGNPELDFSEFGFDGSFASAMINMGLLPGFEWELIEETDRYTIFRDQRGIVMRQMRDYSSMPEWIDYPVKTPDDWYKLKEERLQLDSPGRVTEKDWAAVRDHMATSGCGMQVGNFPYGVFGTPRDLLGVEELLVGFYQEPEMIHDMMDHLTSLWLHIWAQVAAEVQISHIHIWEDMSGRQGSLISPAMVEEFMMPGYDKIAEFAREHNVPIVSVDTDGNCSELVEIMTKHGVNMFFPFEVQAGNDILEYREKYPELGILGGLDKRALAGTKEDVDREIEKVRKMLPMGRYIPGFDHMIQPGATWANFKYAAESIKELCYSV